MDIIEHPIAFEQNEKESLIKSQKSITQTREEQKPNEREHFKDKYIMFCISERKTMSSLLHCDAKICNIMKECYSFSEKIHQAKREMMVDAHLVTSKKSSKESEEVYKITLQMKHKRKIKSTTTNDPLRNLYDELVREVEEEITNTFFKKSLELCWTMVSQCHPMTFSFLDEHMKIDKLTIQPDNKNEKLVHQQGGIVYLKSTNKLRQHSIPGDKNQFSSSHSKHKSNSSWIKTAKSVI